MWLWEINLYHLVWMFVGPSALLLGASWDTNIWQDRHLLNKYAIGTPQTWLISRWSLKKTEAKPLRWIIHQSTEMLQFLGGSGVLSYTPCQLSPSPHSSWSVLADGLGLALSILKCIGCLRWDKIMNLEVTDTLWQKNSMRSALCS